MLISIENNTAFLAMPKTASTSIEAALSPHCDIAFYGNPRVKHIPWRRYNRFVTPYLKRMGFDDIETTCLFREPVSWLFSWYKYRARPEVIGKGQSTRGISFDYFASAYISQDPDRPKVGRPAHFVCNAEGQIMVNHLFRYENIAEYKNFLEGRFNTELFFEHLNTSPNLEMEITTKTRSSLEEYFAPEYEIYESANSK